MNQLKNDNPEYSSPVNRDIKFLYRELLVTKILVALVAFVSLISDGYLLFISEKATTEKVMRQVESERSQEQELSKSQ